MIMQIATAIVSLSESIKIIKQILDLVFSLKLERELSKIDSTASARGRAREVILKGIQGAKDNETRLILADSLYKLSSGNVDKA